MKQNGFFKNLFGRGRTETVNGLQFSIVGYLIERQKRGITLRDDIVHEYSLSPSTADELLGRMERGGLIECGGDSGEVRLTDRGYEVYQAALAQIWQLDIDPADGLDDEVFVALCDGVRETVRETVCEAM